MSLRLRGHQNITDLGLYFRLFVVLGAGAALVTTTVVNPLQASEYWLLALAVLLIAIQAALPITVLEKELTLAHATSLGMALLFSPTVAGWGIVLGALIAFLLRGAIFTRNRAHFLPPPPVFWLEHVYRAAAHLEDQ